MAKRMRRLLVLCMVLIFSISMIATPAMAARGHGDRDDNESSYYEWYQVVVNGTTVASATGPAGNILWLGQTYNAGASISGSTMTWWINPNGGNSGSFGGSVDVSSYVSIPDGYEVAEGGYSVSAQSVTGTNSMPEQYDNCVISVTITALYNPTTGETIPVTEPPATDPDPVETAVTVNHKYSTYDAYTGETTVDGTTTGSETAIEGQSYTAAAVPTYGGNTYTQQTADSALTITIQADASANVINIEYLRTIDTTPVPVETAVTVNHFYYTYDIYTGETVLDGSTTGSETAIEGQSYTAAAVPTYNGNAYAQQTADAALTITIQAHASANVINIEYLRTIDTTPINYTPVLSIVKTADKAVYETGETITWTITVKNVSDYTAYNVSVTDELTGDSWSIASLAPGAEQSYTATTENAAAGSVKNVAVATWEDGDDIPDEDEPNEIKTTSDEEVVGINDPAPENYTPVLSVIKTAGKTTYKEGEAVTWTITVKNVSDYTAYNVVIVDELAKGYWTIESLAPGAEQTFTATMENVAAGSVKNVAVVTWEDGDDIPDEDEPNEIKQTSDEEVVTVEEPENFKPVLSVIKTADKAVYEVGETITWTITVKNISDFPAYYVSVADVVTGDEWNIEVLAAGEEKAFTITMEAEAEGTMTNVVVVNWDDGDEIPNEEETDEPKETTDEETVTVEEPEPPVEETDPPAEETDPPAEETEPVNVPVALDDEIEIPDEDVPLADAPKTGDISALWIALSGISAAGMIVLGKKREEDEE